VGPTAQSSEHARAYSCVSLTRGVHSPELPSVRASLVIDLWAIVVSAFFSPTSRTSRRHCRWSMEDPFRPRAESTGVKWAAYAPCSTSPIYPALARAHCLPLTTPPHRFAPPPTKSVLRENPAVAKRPAWSGATTEAVRGRIRECWSRKRSEFLTGLRSFAVVRLTSRPASPRHRSPVTSPSLSSLCNAQCVAAMNWKTGGMHDWRPPEMGPPSSARAPPPQVSWFWHAKAWGCSRPSIWSVTALIRSSRTASRSYSWSLDVDRADPIDRARIKSWPLVWDPSAAIQYRFVLIEDLILAADFRSDGQ
jgi:hypothetical protein